MLLRNATWYQRSGNFLHKKAVEKLAPSEVRGSVSNQEFASGLTCRKSEKQAHNRSGQRVNSRPCVLFDMCASSPLQETSMPLQKLREFLDQHHVEYVVISHSVAYTAQGIAALAHIPGKDLAKTVMVNLDGELAMAVLPASFLVDLPALKKASGAANVELASETQFKGRFPDCETGAMPPFGNLYGMRVFVDDSLTRDKEIVFNAESHRELVRMRYSDFERLVEPRIAKFTSGKHATAA
jgi:Ala-tRNA(Pro) deacylase